MIYLLDTNTCVEYLRNRSQRLILRVNATPRSDVHVCSIVRAELVGGAHRSGQPRANLQKVLAFLQPFRSLPFDDASADAAGVIRADLIRRGTPIGANDLLIAAIAVANSATLVTHNM